MMNEFRERLTYLREKAGYTQEEASRLLGYSDDAFCNYESGYWDPDRSVYISLARVFDVSLHYLMTGEEFQPGSPKIKPKQ